LPVGYFYTTYGSGSFIQLSSTIGAGITIGFASLSLTGVIQSVGNISASGFESDVNSALTAARTTAFAQVQPAQYLASDVDVAVAICR